MNQAPHNKRMQSDVAYGHAADARRYEVLPRVRGMDGFDF